MPHWYCTLLAIDQATWSIKLQIVLLHAGEKWRSAHRFSIQQLPDRLGNTNHTSYGHINLLMVEVLWSTLVCVVRAHGIGVNLPTNELANAGPVVGMRANQWVTTQYFGNIFETKLFFLGYLQF